MTERHVGCGGRVVLGHEAWSCQACGASPVPVDDVEHTQYRLDPVAHGREDCDDAVRNGADAAAMARDPQGADEALINAMNRSWVMDAAGADPRADQDEEWHRVGLPWCRAYNEAFRARAEELATGDMTVRWTSAAERRTAELRMAARGYRLDGVYGGLNGAGASEVGVFVPIADTDPTHASNCGCGLCAYRSSVRA